MKPIVVLFIIFSLLQACTEQEIVPSRLYSTQSDSCLFYYQRGWEQIMDEGFYGPAEASYRQALAFDPDFLIGQSVLARLTTDLEERLALYTALEDKKSTIQGPERQLLDIYIGLTAFTNAREQNSAEADSILTEVLRLAERNFRQIVHQYPNEIHLKAEYIEILNAVHGPQLALDSMAILTNSDQKDNPFLIGYQASLEAKLGNYEKALASAHQLAQLSNMQFPKSHAVYADVYFQMDSLVLAKTYADRAVQLDPRNLDASRLEAKIEQQLDEAQSVK